MLDRLWRAHRRRQERKLWRGVCGALGIAYAEPIATGTFDGLRVEIWVTDRQHPTRIATGLPSTIGFARREGTVPAPKFGDVWFDANVVLRGDLALWLGVLDRATRKSLESLVRMSSAALRDGTLELRDSVRASVKQLSVDEHVAPIRAAAALANRLLAAQAKTDDTALFAACKQGSQRERLVALTLVRTQRASDPRTQELIGELDGSSAPDDQMLAAIGTARWARIAELANQHRSEGALLAETIETLRALYPRVDTIPELVALAREYQSPARVAAALVAICNSLSAG